MGHADAQRLLTDFKKSVDRLHLGKLLQVSMDGPNVNWKFYNLLETEVKDNHGTVFLNIGSCGLHVMHGAFQRGFMGSADGVDKFLSSLYWLFKDTPARREDYMKLTSSDAFPLKFCKHRWLENAPVTERALSLLNNMRKYVGEIQNGKLKDPKTKSFVTVRDALKDPLLEAKLNAYLSVAKLMTPFLTLYQCERPLGPFLCGDLQHVIKSLLRRFVTSEVIRDSNTAIKLVNLDVSDRKIQCEQKKIDLGFSAVKQLSSLLANKKVSERQVLELRLEYKEGLVKMVEKLQEKCPLKYSIVRNLKCLDPREMYSDRAGCLNKMKRLLKHLVEAKKVPESKCDDIVREFGEFIDDTVPIHASRFKDFNPKDEKQRVDELFYDTMHGHGGYENLWMVVSLLLLMTHGQAAVEHGFSINKELSVENLMERSFVSLRVIHDHIHTVGGVLNVKLSKQLILAAGGARQKYMAYLDQEKLARKTTQDGQKRKSVLENVEELRAKKRRIEIDIKSLTKSSEQFADKAETTGHITCIAKSNSLRRSAKDKSLELDGVQQKMDELLKTLAN